MLSYFQFSRRSPGRNMFLILWWDLSMFTCMVLMKIFYRISVTGRRNIPTTGPVLFISTHQTFLDPSINSICTRYRPFRPIARFSLFRFKPFAWLISSYGAISIQQGSGQSAPLRIALEQLERGQCVLIYAEGTRTRDGSVQPLQKGAALIIKRSKVPIVPIAIEGAYDIWPPSRKLPRLSGRINVVVGEPIMPERIEHLRGEEVLRELHQTLESLRVRSLRTIQQRTNGRWPRRFAPEQATPGADG